MYEVLQDKLYQDEPEDKISQKELLPPADKASFPVTSH